jgi:tripartite-type tricarboxylate transporter receptor subunit TctC
MVRWAGLALLFGLAPFVQAAPAQSYPDRPIRVISPNPAGGSNDTIVRIVAAKMSAILDTPIVVDNRGGAGGKIGAEAAAHAPPDGYTLLAGSVSTHSFAPVVTAKLNYDPIKDFEPISLIALVQNLLVVNPKLPATTMQELVALAKAQPGKLNYASAGIGGLPHLAGELFKLTAKIDIVHIPYRGAAPAINDLLGQQVQMAFLDLPVILPQIKAGTLRPIALGAPARSPLAPDVPTTAEVGMPDLLIENWYGMIAPGGTPEKIVAELNRITNEAMADPGVKAKLADQGLTVAGNTPAHFRSFIESESRKWAKVIKDAGLQTTR